MNSLDLVREFHVAYGQGIADAPSTSNAALNALRVSLLREELDELDEALACRSDIAVLDALVDLQYVLDGAFLALGFHGVRDEAIAEVHRSNMSKLGANGRPVLRADGKILKGPNYSPPDLGKVLADAQQRRLCQRHDDAMAAFDEAVAPLIAAPIVPVVASFRIDEYGTHEVLMPAGGVSGERLKGM